MMSLSRVVAVRMFVSGVLFVGTLAGCTSGTPSRPGADGGAAGAKGTGGLTGVGTGGDIGAGTGGDIGAGTGGDIGAGGTPGSGGAVGTGGTVGIGGRGIAGGGGTQGGAGIGGATLTGGTTETGGATSAGGAAGPMASCTKALFGLYLLRNDGALLYETEPPSTAQTPVLDAGSALPLAGVVAAREGPKHGCAVLGSSMTVWCWRSAADGNSVGQLGNGVMDQTGATFRASQVLVAANQPLANVVAIDEGTASTGGNNTCAVTADGKVYCWGTLTFVTNGGTTLNVPFATPITTDGVTPLTGVVQVSLDNTYACALMQAASSKEVWCWGSNSLGNLGTGDTTLRRYPTKVLGLTNPTKVLAFGYAGNLYFNNGTTCVLEGQNVRCWGSNTLGQVGNGMTNSPILSPTIVTLMGGTAPLSEIVDIRGGGRTPNGGYQDICALTTSHTAQCWGSPFQPYPSAYPFSGIAALGSLDFAAFRFLTLDGLYHIAPTSGAAATVRVPNCGLLQ